MKYRILIVVFIFLLYGCKEYKYSELVVYTENENKNSGNLPLMQMTIFKDGKFYKKIEPKNELFIDNPIKLDSLEKGVYEFKYHNLFGEKTSKFYTAKNRKEKDSLKIFIDQIDYSKNIDKSIIKKLKNDSLKINYQSVGCFHSIYDSLTVKNENSNYFINYKNKTTKLNEKQVEKLIKFESELYSLPKEDGGCTTEELYRLNFKGKIKEIGNGYCVWSGWQNFKEDLRFK